MEKPPAGPRPLGRFEIVVAGFFVACWFLALSGLLGLAPLAGTLALGLYPLFSVSAIVGWVMGNVYVQRTLKSARLVGVRLPRELWIYLLGPPGGLLLLRSMAPRAEQEVAPLVPVLAVAVFVVFFLVPVSLSVTGPTRKTFQLRPQIKETERAPEQEETP